METIKTMGRDSVYAYKCNVADREEVLRVAKKVKEEVGDVTILINNAGIVFVKSFLNQSPDEIIRVIDVNVIAHYWTLKAFLPNMIKKNHGHIVAISSVAGLFIGCYGTVYSPSKFAIKGNSTTYFTIIEKEVCVCVCVCV
ncbi:Short chain dehydrogenase/reductase family 16C member 6 [Acromyrmex echinatior]|uniref:Short chain dehydrogenase/reductase family 16C member 6 n=1 Tax=Acromyrmex echinatior TaxID=103372 RepID=F4X5U4_ACREC|nr:Short chain dehydrogenase/reductase family 16C member 6 [Acromyrmex echinatior]